MKIKICAFSLVLALTACQEKSATNQCDRECLESTIENYLQALVAQDVSRIKVADDVVFSENNQILELGDGSWKTFTGSGSYRHYFADPQTQQVAVISTMRENGKGVIYDLRLRLQGDAISEIESMVIRSPGSAEQYEKLGSPPPNFVDIIPEDQRNSREELLAIPRKYLKGMENNDPNGDYSFFDDECNRYEHAVKTTNSEPKHVGHTESTTFSTMTCKAQFSGGGLAFVTRIRDERYNTHMVVDEEKQAVFGFVFLDHNGTVHEITRADGQSYKIPSYFSTPRGLMVGEAWRVRDNKLFEIEMTLTEIPYGERPNFGLDAGNLNEGNNEWLQSKNINPNNYRIADDCDQACLNQVISDFLSALVVHDYSKLPLSTNVRYRENGQDLAVGDGLWGTATELSDYQVYLSNPEAGEAGLFGAITEYDVPSLLSARLKIKGGLIEDINVTVMRHEYTGSRGGTLSLFYPQIDGMFNPEAFAALDAELSRAGNSSLDNMIAQINSTNANRDSVVLVADAERGLVLEQSVRDIVNASTDQTDKFLSGGYSVLTSTLYKFSGNELILKKSVSKPIPYKMPL